MNSLRLSEGIVRYLHAATLVAVSVLVPAVMYGQPLSITNYQLVSQQVGPRNQLNLTYRADIVNSGPAVGGVTASVTSLDPFTIRLLPGAGTLTFPPVPSGGQVTSTNTFTIIVTGLLDVTKLQWSFEISPPPPVSNPGPNQTTTVGSTVTLNGSGSTNPSGIGTITYGWAFVSRPAGSTALLGHPNSVSASFVVDVPGNYIVALTVSNGVASSTANVTVSTFKTPPVANAGSDQMVPVGTTVHLNGGNSTSPDGRTLTYSWILNSRPANSSATLTGANTVSPSFIADKPGTYTAQLTVNDGMPSNTSTVTVTTTLVKPTANAGDAKVVTAGDVVHLDGSKSTDANGLQLTYAWSFLNKPPTSAAQLSNATLVNPVFTADVPGDYVLQLVVSNGTLTDTATVMITTQPSLSPTANAGTNQTVGVGAMVQLAGSGTDPQQLPLTYAWVLISKPVSSAAALSSPTIANPTFVADLAGKYVAQLIVNNGVQSSQPSTVTISTACSSPTANAGQSQNVTVGATVMLSGSLSGDACSDPLTYAWSLTSVPQGSTAALSGANTVSPSFVADQPGAYVAQLIVDNGFSKSDPVSVMITAVSTGIILSPDPLNLTNVAANLTVTLPVAAGPGGQTVNLFNLSAGIATLAASVKVPEGMTSVDVPVTPVSPGTTTVFASSPGYRTARATVNVSSANIAITLEAASIGLTRTINGTVTLSGVASGDVVVTLGATPGGIVTLPATVTVSSGTASKSFTVTGAGVGTAVITASAPNYANGTTNVTVSKLGAISLAHNVMVGIGQTVPIAVSLASGAPLGGVTVTLVSADGSIATVTPGVDIAFKANSPISAAQVTGVAAGTVQITASAPGFDGDTQTVTVATSSFDPVSASISVSNSQDLTLTLSAPAPPTGLTATLVSNNTAVATVPVSVSFAPGALTASVKVTAVGTGSTTISASSPNFGTASAVITVP